MVAVKYNAKLPASPPPSPPQPSTQAIAMASGGTAVGLKNVTPPASIPSPDTSRDDLKDGPASAIAGLKHELNGGSNTLKLPELKEFELIRVLGKGCAGRVLLVKHTPTARVHAMKAISKRAVLANDELDHTLAEQAILRQFSTRERRNAFISRLYHSFTDKENFYLVMEFYPGGDLATQMEIHGIIGPLRTRFYTCDIVAGLEVLHREGVLVRDLKPENILLNWHGHAVLADFGLSKSFGHRGDPIPVKLPPDYIEGKGTPPPYAGKGFGTYRGDELTWDRAYSFVGTQEYLAPEVIKRNHYTYAIDWWALGCIVCECLTGRVPFRSSEDEGTAELYERVINAPWDEIYRLDQPRSYLKDKYRIDATTYDFIDGLLQKEPMFRLTEPCVKIHSYFTNVDWDTVDNGDYQDPFGLEIDPIAEYNTQFFPRLCLEETPTVDMRGHDYGKSTENDHQTALNSDAIYAAAQVDYQAELASFEWTDQNDDLDDQLDEQIDDDYPADDQFNNLHTPDQRNVDNNYYQAPHGDVPDADIQQDDMDAESPPLTDLSPAIYTSLMTPDSMPYHPADHVSEAHSEAPTSEAPTSELATSDAPTSEAPTPDERVAHSPIPTVVEIPSVSLSSVMSTPASHTGKVVSSSSNELERTPVPEYTGRLPLPSTIQTSPTTLSPPFSAPVAPATCGHAATANASAQAATASQLPSVEVHDTSAEAMSPPSQIQILAPGISPQNSPGSVTARLPSGPPAGGLSVSDVISVPSREQGNPNIIIRRHRHLPSIDSYRHARLSVEIDGATIAALGDEDWEQLDSETIPEAVNGADAKGRSGGFFRGIGILGKRPSSRGLTARNTSSRVPSGLRKTVTPEVEEPAEADRFSNKQRPALTSRALTKIKAFPTPSRRPSSEQVRQVSGGTTTSATTTATTNSGVSSSTSPSPSSSVRGSKLPTLSPPLLPTGLPKSASMRETSFRSASDSESVAASSTIKRTSIMAAFSSSGKRTVRNSTTSTDLPSLFSRPKSRKGKDRRATMAPGSAAPAGEGPTGAPRLELKHTPPIVWELDVEHNHGAPSSWRR